MDHRRKFIGYLGLFIFFLTSARSHVASEQF